VSICGTKAFANKGKLIIVNSKRVFEVEMLESITLLKFSPFVGKSQDLLLLATGSII
jgi:hypothetical protein